MRCSECGHALPTSAMACVWCGEPVPEEKRAPIAVFEPEPEDYEWNGPPRPGSLILRFVANIVDTILLIPVIVLVWLWAGLGAVNWDSRDPQAFLREVDGIAAETFWWVLGIQLAYFAIFEASAMRGTPGKWFLGLAVSDNDGYQLGLVHTTMRAAAKLAVLLVFAPIVLLALFSRQKQTLYDIFLGTRVIRLSDARDPEKEDDADRTAEPRAREPIAETPGE